MAISLTTDGLSLDYRTEEQGSVSGTYPIGTVIVTSSLENGVSFPGTWAMVRAGASPYVSSTIDGKSVAIRVS